MDQDQDGQTVGVGYEGFLPFTVLSVNTDGTMRVQTPTTGTYTGMIIDNVPTVNAHKGTNNWPDLP